MSFVQLHIKLTKMDRYIHIWTLVLVFILQNDLTIEKIVKEKFNSNKDEKSSINGLASLLANMTATFLKDYDPSVQPSCVGDEQVRLDVNMAVRQLILLNEPEQKVKFSMWMRLKWRDCRIWWNPEDYGGETDVILPIQQIWVPDLTLYESVAEEFYGFKDFRPRILSDGTIWYNFPTMIEAVCKVQVLKFPFDTQICQLKFGSWAHHGLNLDLFSSKGAADLSALKDHVEWKISSAQAARHVVKYGCCPEPYPDVTFYIHLTRKPAAYVTNIIIPSTLITLISALGFLLPVESGEKVALQLTVMLAIFVFQVLIADELPPSADSTPWISFFLSFTLLLCGVASLLQVLVINIYFRQGDMPLLVRKLVLKPLALFTCVTLPSRKRRSSGVDPPSDKENMMIENVPEGRTMWMYLASVLDRVGLAFFLFVFFIGCFIAFNGMTSDE